VKILVERLLAGLIETMMRIKITYSKLDKRMYDMEIIVSYLKMSRLINIHQM
jgi:hypothetical protein